MKAYKQLRKKLKNKFTNPYSPNEGYCLEGGIISWITQCDISYKPKHLRILYDIYGGGFYPFQEQNRKKILKYLKKHKEL